MKIETNLNKIAGGEAQRLFETYCSAIFDNIQDEGTDEKKTREINLRFRFSPTSARDSAIVEVDGTCKLAPQSGGTTQLRLFNGKVVEKAVEKPIEIAK